jgi:hypothetical protein
VVTGVIIHAQNLSSAIYLDNVQFVDLATNTFTTLPAGSTLPSDSTCAGLVRRSPWEPRPNNATANATAAANLPLPDWTSVNSLANTYIKPRITGSFVGTTDEQIQFYACKWGFDEDRVRAVVAQESWWRQETVGDGGISFGVIQIKSTVWADTHPDSEDSVAFNLDYGLAVRRMCFEGYIPWLTQKAIDNGYTTTVDDEVGCEGFWFSGDWYDGDPDDPNDPNDAWSGAKGYISHVEKWLAQEVWRTGTFPD